MNPYALLIAGGLWIASLTGCWFYAQHVEANAWRVKVAEQKIEAGKVMAGALQRLRDKENADAEQARQIDEKHKAELDAANAGRTDFDRRLREARRGARCSNAGAIETTHPVVSEDAPRSSDDGSGSIDPASRLRDATLNLQAYAKACNAWAISVGR